MHSLLRIKSTIVLALSLAMMLSVQTCVQAAEKGSLLIVGGALKSSNREVYQAFIDGLLPKGPVVIIPAASSSPASSAQSVVDNLTGYGVALQRILIFPLAMKDDRKTTKVDERKWHENAWHLDTVKGVEQAAGFWFTGGDQMRIVSLLRDPDRGESPLLKLIRARLDAGAIVGGTSAGAAIMSDNMIVGGNSFNALLAPGISPYHQDEGQHSGALSLDRGLGFLPTGIVDQHFDRQARLGRLVRALVETGQRYGYGIDEDTGLLIKRATLDATVIGAASVTLVDVGDARFNFKRQSQKSASWSQLMQGARLSIAQSGNQLSLKTLEFDNPPGEATIGNEYYDHAVRPGGGIAFPQRSLAQTLGRGLLDNRASQTVRSYSLGCDGEIVIYHFAQNKHSNGFWHESPNGGRYIIQNVEFSVESGRAGEVALSNPC